MHGKHNICGAEARSKTGIYTAPTPRKTDL